MHRFLSEYTGNDRPQALDGIRTRLARPRTKCRHDTAVDVACWIVREAAAGYYPGAEGVAVLRQWAGKSSDEEISRLDSAVGWLVPGQGYPATLHGMQVRRLTPRECERLQGFPDDYTAITYRGKPAADGPRYKALGNSMAVPVMRWIGQQLDRAPPAQAEPQEGDLLHTMMEWARTEEGRTGWLAVEAAGVGFLFPLQQAGEIFPLVDVQPLAHARNRSTPEGGPGPWTPVLWTREWEGARVVFDALGHNARSLDHPVHRALLERAVTWVLGRENPASATANKA